jgi:GR25 family glycosyltransferase involved in LPS biosynthesis
MNGFYINRVDKPDRKNHILSNISKLPFFSSIKRMDAIINENGRIGCTMSHIKCLEELLKKNDEYFLIIEDDLDIKNNHFDTFVKDFDTIKDNQWDIIVLGGTICKCTMQPNLKNFHRLTFSYTTTGYIVKKKYIPTLLNNFKMSLDLLIHHDIRDYYIDVYWNRLQIKDQWYIYTKSFISQLHDWSTTELKLTNYDKLFATYYFNIMDNLIKFDATL